TQQLLAGLQNHSAPYGGGGGWGSTHATVLALKALECAASRERTEGNARIVIEVNGEALPPIELSDGALTPHPSPSRGEGDQSGGAAQTGGVAIPLTLPHGKSKLRIKVSGG